MNKNKNIEKLENINHNMTDEQKQKYIETIKDRQKEYKKEYRKNMSDEQKQKRRDYQKE